MRSVESNAKFVIALWIFAAAAIAAALTQILPGVITMPKISGETVALTLAFAMLTIGIAPLAATGIFDSSVPGVFLFTHFATIIGIEKYDGLTSLGFAVAIAFAAVIANGFFHSVLRLPTTFATLITGVAASIGGAWLAQSRTVASNPLADYADYYHDDYFLPICAAIVIFFAIITHLFMTRSTTGLRLRAIGDNAEKAGMIGINRRSRLVLAYLFGAGAAVIAAIISAGAARDGISAIFFGTYETIAEIEMLNFLSANAKFLFVGIFVGILVAAPLWCATAAGRRGHINVVAILLATLAIAVFVSTISPLVILSYFIGALLLLAGLCGREKKIKN